MQPKKNSVIPAARETCGITFSRRCSRSGWPHLAEPRSLGRPSRRPIGHVWRSPLIFACWMRRNPFRLKWSTIVLMPTDASHCPEIAGSQLTCCLEACCPGGGSSGRPKAKVFLWCTMNKGASRTHITSSWCNPRQINLHSNCCGAPPDHDCAITRISCVRSKQMTSIPRPSSPDKGPDRALNRTPVGSAGCGERLSSAGYLTRQAAQLGSWPTRLSNRPNMAT